MSPGAQRKVAGTLLAARSRVEERAEQVLGDPGVVTQGRWWGEHCLDFLDSIQTLRDKVVGPAPAGLAGGP